MSALILRRGCCYSPVHFIGILFLTVLFITIAQHLLSAMDHPDLVISIEDKNDEQEQPSSALFRRSLDENTTFSYQNRTLETTIRCVGSAYNQTCLYQNLYYVDGQFIILTIKGRPLPFYTVSSNAFAPWATTPSKRQFDSYADLEQFIASLVNRTVMPSVTLYFGQYWHFSIGHALFDGLYPAYLALIRFSPRHLHPFRILADIDNCTDCWVEDIYSRFAGLGLLKESTLQHMSHGRWFVFDELIMGSGTLCQRCTQPHLQLPGGVELNGSRLFRDRMYTQHDLPIPIRRRRRTLAAYIIDNKRFTFDDRREIDDAKVELNQYTYAMLRARNGPVARYRWPLILVHYLHYNRIRGRRTNAAMNSSRSGDNAWAESKFKGQLKVLRQMDIHVSGPGTGQMYQTFLSDGSVHVNLGGVRPIAEEHTEQAYASYLEQHMTSGTPYIKGLYYPINQQA